VTQVTDNEKARVVLIGASYMIRLEDNMGSDTVSLAVQGFSSREPTISEITDELQKLGLSNRDTVVLDLLSNSAFMGTDSYGLPTEVIRTEDVSYHVIGSLTGCFDIMCKNDSVCMYSHCRSTEEHRGCPAFPSASVHAHKVL
jgi:hypothetical protein